MDKYTKVVLTVIVLFGLCGCMAPPPGHEEARQQDISRYQSSYENLELIELCLVVDEAEIVLGPDGGGSRSRSAARLRIIAISRELERRKLDPLLCRKQSK